MIIVILVLILLIILFKRSSSEYKYTFQDIDVIRYFNPSFVPKTFEFYIASLDQQPLVTIVNEILSFAPKDIAQPIVPYTSDTQLATMFDTAYKNGESGLTFTDRVLLRALIFPYLEFVIYSKPVTWDNNGKPSTADEVLLENESVQDNMKKVFKLLSTFSQGGGPTQDDIMKINAILPSNLSLFKDPADYTTRMRNNTDATLIHFIKYITIGPLYLQWLAETKYKLDMNFKILNTPSPSPSPV